MAKNLPFCEGERRDDLKLRQGARGGDCGTAAKTISQHFFAAFNEKVALLHGARDERGGASNPHGFKLRGMSRRALVLFAATALAGLAGALFVLLA